MSFASISGVTLHYRVSGTQDGPPLILINSLGTNLHIWDDMQSLLGMRYRILAYDKRGHGLSDAPPGPYGLDQHVADLLGLANRCGFPEGACNSSFRASYANALDRPIVSLYDKQTTRGEFSRFCG
jgi:3-oxoadipate enol-lactonase